MHAQRATHAQRANPSPVARVLGRYMHAHAAWQDTAVLASYFEGKFEKKKAALAAGCCNGYFKGCCQPPAPPLEDISSTAAGTKKYTPQFEEFIQTFTAEKTGLAETKTGAKQTPSISLTEREHGSTKSVHTLHMLYRSPDSIWQGDNCDAVVAVISPGVPMDMVITFVSTIQSIMPPMAAFEHGSAKNVKKLIEQLKGPRGLMMTREPQSVDEGTREADVVETKHLDAKCVNRWRFCILPGVFGVLPCVFSLVFVDVLGCIFLGPLHHFGIGVPKTNACGGPEAVKKRFGAYDSEFMAACCCVLGKDPLCYK